MSLIPPQSPPVAELLDVRVDLDADESHHARQVLRLGPGAAVELFDGRGTVAQGTIAAGPGPGPGSAGGKAVNVRVTQARRVSQPVPAIDVAAAVPKGPRGDEMVNQLSQLGADRFTPLVAGRSVVNPGAGKLARYSRAAVAAAKQCGRAYVMDVCQPVDLAAALARPYDLRLLAAPGGAGAADGAGGAHRVAEALRRAAHVLILIGPEGGWTDAETALAAAHGCLIWSLGPNVLRIETAAAAAVAVARYLAAHEPERDKT